MDRTQQLKDAHPWFRGDEGSRSLDLDPFH